MAQNASFHARALLALVSVWGVVLALPLALTACEPEDVKTPPVCGAVPCDLREESCQELVLDVLQCLRGGDEELPQIDVISEDEYRELDLGPAELSAEEAERRARFEHGLSLLQLSAYGGDAGDADLGDLDADGGVDDADAGSDAGADDVDVAAHVAAQYLRDEQRIVVVDHDTPSDSLEAFAIMAHELVHALQDRAYDLEEFTDGAKSYDEKIARRGVIEGEAKQYDVLTYAALQGYPPGAVDWWTFYVSWQLDEAHNAYDAAEPLRTVLRRYPAPFGGYALTHEWLQFGPPAVERLFEDPPRSSLEVLAAGRLIDDEAERADELQELLVPVAPEPFELVAYDQLGSFVLDVFLHHYDLTNSPNVEADVIDMIADGVSVFYDAAEQRTVVAWRLRYAQGAGLRSSQIAQWRSALDAPDSDEPEAGPDVKARVASAEDEDLIVIVSDAPLDPEWLSNDLEWQAPPPGAQTPGY